MPDVLTNAGCSLLVSTYQAGQLAAIGAADGRLTVSFRALPRPMGVAVDPDGAGLRVASRDQVWLLGSAPGIAPELPPAGTHDTCYLPRTSTFTGDIQAHELVWLHPPGREPRQIVVNTAFSCLAEIDDLANFRPLWRPPFITRPAAEDRCHLNGVAVRDGRASAVTLMAATDEAHGWRRLPKSSGVVLDVPSGEVITSGLVMPHSPRWYDGRLHVLNSGLGQLQRVDLASGARETVAALPGYTRGLALHAGLAFVGLSRIRETAVFGEVPLAAHHDRLRCGIGVVDLATGTTVATLQFTSAVEEIFDVQVLPGVRSPALSGPDGQEVWLAS
ncbi:uncharacterized protein (TIGR03032 family) [Nocardioides nitrophenolicus]|nr:uncharacterized protein (TIGR03032 family) [Nocardioides nitrophenolicus]